MKREREGEKEERSIEGSSSSPRKHTPNELVGVQKQEKIQLPRGCRLPPILRIPSVIDASLTFSTPSQNQITLLICLRPRSISRVSLLLSEQ